ncbi:hypothetical protein BDV96DRAFT_647863 [Lophiotrema nucula]|uniref:Zn(2)-C6 fungal-type domain-containing protein n=1 Tax=Lophiotrema nucula TaxID=690887 RepID=A0A6A5Z5B7_9PLEO|nr:hypothetical protein BDV96DRAFT_647863 [Lophiotrema nucula]
MPRKSQGLRSYHHKSRNGCSNCKRRRVKCNLQAPACANCVRRGELCEYQMFSQDLPSQWCTEVSVRGTVPLAFPTTTAGGSLELVPTSSNTHPIQSQLSRHASPTSGTLESCVTHPDPFRFSLSLAMKGSFFEDSEKALWLPSIEKAGMRYAYVQHAFLSVSSLLFELDNPSQRMPVTAYQHHLTASSLFRLNAPNIVEDNWIAVISFGVMMIIFEFAVQQSCPEPHFDLLHSLLVLRNFMKVDNEVAPYLHKTKMWPLIQKRNAAFMPPADNQLQTSFRNMANLIAQLLKNGVPNAETNRQAFWELREWSYGCNEFPRNWRHYCEWPASVSDAFMQLFAEEDDVAMLITIHWCSVLYQSPKRWYITRWAQRAALYLISKLKGDCSDLLVWPLSVVLDNGVIPTFPTLAPFFLPGEPTKSLPVSHIDPLLS